MYPLVTRCCSKLAMLVALSFIALCTGCFPRDQEPTEIQSDQPARPVLDFAVTDTAEWECAGNGGSSGTLLVDGTYLDTVDIYLGVQPVVDGLIFMPMQTEESEELGASTCPTEPVLYDGAEKTLLGELLPMFNGAFSNPFADDSVVYYWGFRDGGLYAVRYNLGHASVDTTFLTDDSVLLATGNRYQFLMPEMRGDTVVYSTWPGRTFFLNMGMALMTDSTR